MEENIQIRAVKLVKIVGDFICPSLNFAIHFRTEIINHSKST